jgi:3-phenylpropionate/trans-cinnamate dioxygenase ferredoxin reductase subunit
VITVADPIVVIGAGMAGGRAVQTLVKHPGRDRPIVLVGDEAYRPYRRPPLSKGALTEERSNHLFLHSESYYGDNSVDLVLAKRAIQLVPDAKMVVLEDGSAIRYSRVILTPGCANRALRVPGADLDGVVYLRTLPESTELRRRLAEANEVVVVGAGFIGTEIAATCRSLGKTVTLVEAGPSALWSVLGREIGELVQQRHELNDVTVLTNELVAEIEGDTRAKAVVFKSGTKVSADLVVIGIGVEPNTSWLESSGVTLDDGVVVDDHCRTNIERVYAAGDAARWHHPMFGSLRIEHEANAHQQAAVAARNLMGDDLTYAAVPYSWSDQAAMRLRYVGHASDWDLAEVHPGTDDALVVLYMREGLVRAVFCLDDMDSFSRARDLFEQHGCFPAEVWTSDAPHKGGSRVGIVLPAMEANEGLL